MKKINPVNTAVVGLGQIGKVHAEWYTQIPESNLIAVCDEREEVARKIASKYDVKAYSRYEDLLDNREIEAVQVAVPNFLHSKVAIAAAKAGKNVAVEKPLCNTLHDADEMINAVKKAGVIDFYNENLCFAPSYKLAKQVIENGGLGDVYLCKAYESNDYVEGSEGERETVEKSWYLKPEMAGGGMLMSTGCHPIQYVRYVFDGARALRVNAEIIDSIGLGKPKGMEDFALVTIRFEGDRVGEVHTSSYSTGSCDDRAEIYGSRGSVFLDLYRGNEIKVHSHNGYNMLGQSMYSPPKDADKGWAFLIPDEKYDLGYYNEQRYFLQCVREGKRPKVNFDDGRATLEIILAAYKSHETGKTVDLPLA